MLPPRVKPDDRLSFVDHLDELRARLIVSLAALSVAFGVAYGFRHFLLDSLNRPLDGRLPTTLGVAEPFTTSFKVAMFAAIALALPVLLWQVWSFLAPALDDRSETAIARLVVIGTVLFGCGAAFAYFVVLPSATPFLLSFDSDQYVIQIRASDYYGFAALTILGIGALFELPVFLLGLVRLGVLSAARLRRSRRIGIVVCFAIAVALPGIDPVTTAIQAVPLLMLFEGSIWAARFFERRWARQRRRAGAPLAADS